MIIPFLKRIVQWVRTFVRSTFHAENPNLPYYITIVVCIVLFGVALKGFVELTGELVGNRLGPFDTAITDWVIAHRSENLTMFFKFMTEVGDQTAYIIVTVLIGAYFFLRHRNWKFIVQTIAVLLLATITNVVLKEVIHRERPSIEHMVQVYTLSYPSGHSMSAMAYYGFLFYLSGQMVKGLFARIFLRVIFVLVIFSIGLSRIYLGVHFPSDVLAGFIGGFLWVNLCIVIFQLLHLLRSRKRSQQGYDKL